jgi:hypothetical protein
MALMIAELYDALLAVNAPEDKARKAAEAVAAYEQRFASLDTRLSQLDGKLDTLRAELKGEMAWVKWMLGTNLVFTLGVLWKLLKP